MAPKKSSTPHKLFNDAVRLKDHSVTELARTLADWSWKNKRKSRMAIPACKAEDHIDMALSEIRILAPQGKAFALFQFFRKKGSLHESVLSVRHLEHTPNRLAATPPGAVVAWAATASGHKPPY